jgi:hypothetical protein
MASISAHAREEAAWEAAWEAEWDAMAERQRDYAIRDAFANTMAELVTTMSDSLDEEEWEAEYREQCLARRIAEQPKWEVNFAKTVAYIEQHGCIPKSAWVRCQREEGAMLSASEIYANPFHAARVQKLEALPLWRCAKRAVL